MECFEIVAYVAKEDLVEMHPPIIRWLAEWFLGPDARYDLRENSPIDMKRAKYRCMGHLMAVRKFNDGTVALIKILR